MGAETANTSVTVFRGTTTNAYADVIDSDTPYIQGMPVTLVETGKRVQDPSTPTPRTVRQITCIVPQWAGILDTDRLMDERTGDKYIIISVTKPPTLIGAPVDITLGLKRVSANAA
jgi:hypothetical protein